MAMRFIPKRRWLQFRLQTLFALMTIAALAGVVIKQRLQEQKAQAENATLRAKNAALEAQSHALLKAVGESQLKTLTSQKPSEFQLPHLERKIDEQLP
jgi:cell division protein FtsB